MFTVTHALVRNVKRRATRFNIIPPYSLDLRLVRFLNLFQSFHQVTETDLPCVANDIDGWRQQAADDKEFFSVTALDASEGQFVIYQGGFESHLAVTEFVKKTGDSAINQTAILPGAQHGDLVQCFDADPLAAV